MFRLIFQNIVSLFAPQFSRPFLLGGLGHDIHSSAKVGVVVLGRRVRLKLGPSAKISSANIFLCDEVISGSGSRVGKFNSFQGGVDIRLAENSCIGNFNRFANKREGGKDSAKFSLGCNSNLTSGHYFDITDNISVGNNCVIAGRNSQFWTHGFQHFNKGAVRHRVDGEIVLMDGVYVGSSVIFNPGVMIGESVSIGAGTAVGKSLLAEGTWVGPPLRKIEVSESDFYSRYRPINIRGRKSYKRTRPEDLSNE